MKRTRIILFTLMMACGIEAGAQTIRITEFKHNTLSLIGSTNRVKDNNGDDCAVIRFFIDDNYTIEPHSGVLKTDTLIGEMRMWVPRGTKRITVRREGLRPLAGYDIPLEIESLNTYEATIETINEEAEMGKRPKKRLTYMGLGYQFPSLSGPSLALGFNIKHHQIEVGGIYGMKKTDELFFYDNSGNTLAGYQYSPVRAQLKYGYEIELGKHFALTPQVGGAFNYFMGKEKETTSLATGHKKSFSVSLIGDLRLSLSLNKSKTSMLYVAPEYNVCVKRGNTCNIVSWYDATMKKWNEGFNLNAGVMFFL